MDLAEARAVLGVGADDDWSAVRAAFRRLLRATHPDVAAKVPDATARTARLTEAYRVVRLAHESPVPTAPAPPPPPPAPERATVGVCVEHGALLVRSPRDEAFFRLLELAHEVGEVTYIDQQVGLLEAVVQFEGYPVCSLLVTLQGRAGGTEAFLTIEPIERGAPPPLEAVVLTLAARLGAPVP
ncbi:MAG TPA: DnaJ domain-containing protein [Acidimicrobiales bacterium]